jgi:predicted ATPase/DNA-binding XRE family transcriptional regulator
MSDDIASFGAYLRRLRRAAALSQEELAERAGLSARGISDLERGARRTPRLTTVRLLADGLGLDAADRAALTQAARLMTSADPAPDALAAAVPFPIPLTSLIGRERELGEVASLLARADVRLVTITGAGGTGKTRLALEAGAELGADFEDGVAFIDLAPLRDAELVLPTIAAALGVGEQRGQRLRDTLAHVLAGRQMLLVADNFEQVIAAAPDVAALLGACPRVSVLATSREALRVRGERIVPLLPLPLPSPDPCADMAASARAPAVALFLERAETVHPDFALTPDNAATVTAICRSLDGLPLAIELAAARIRVLSPDELLIRLVSRLPMLTGGGRDLPARQRTMRSTIAWSYDLLGDEEQRLFRRLAVFAGGWTLNAAEAVIGAGDDLDVLAGMEALVAASLVLETPHRDVDRRFTMLETVREFGLERLADSGEEAAVRDFHARHVAEQVDAFRFDIEGPQRAVALTRMIRNLDNVRAALAWAVSRQNAEAAQRIAGPLGPFWMDWGLMREGRTWIERALAIPGTAPIVTPEAHYWAGALALFQDDLGRAEFHAEAGLARSRDANNRFGEGGAVFLLGLVAEARGDMHRAVELLAAALRLLRTTAEQPWRNCLDAVVIQNLGALALQQGELAAARRHFEESFAIWRGSGHPWGISRGLEALANLALREGDAPRALSLYADSLERNVALHDTYHAAWDLLGMGGALLAAGNAEDAVRLLGAAARLFSEMEYVMSASERAAVDPVRDHARTALGEERFAAAWAAGTALERDAAVAESLVLARSAREHTGAGTPHAP